MILPDFYIDDLIKKAITEDINYIDVSSAIGLNNFIVADR